MKILTILIFAFLFSVAAFAASEIDASYDVNTDWSNDPLPSASPTIIVPGSPPALGTLSTYPEGTEMIVVPSNETAKDYTLPASTLGDDVDALLKSDGGTVKDLYFDK